MKALYIIGVIVLLLVVGAGGFYGGVVYAQSQSQNAVADFQRLRTGNGSTNGSDANAGPCGFGQRAGQFNRQGGANQQGGNGQGSAFAQLGNCVARGSIKSIDGNTLQISTPQSVVTVHVSDQTVISKTDTGSLSDLKAGDRVTVFSRESGDSPTASAIQIQRAPGGP